ncbi:MAG TPA: OadG family protein [Methanofastidiosum sp.]|nr:OadG family protein [Methanofastidiosum sp.]HPA49625.1 OadG family protein [Methanofastidiosum sp.]HQK62635.1 OadG family protein [Methanofastidiosum sp.]HQM95024.1 OadG family protein [Methanofastidiosum sp.]HQQ49225.1 OadG family protein [Methanofastidiosum sp.]
MVNMDNLLLGLTLVIVGMAITFLVLVILSGVIHYFGKFIKNREDKANNKVVEEKENLAEAQPKVEKETSNDELTAMITAAYFHISKDAISVLNLHSKIDNWKLLNRREQMERL